MIWPASDDRARATFGVGRRSRRFVRGWATSLCPFDRHEPSRNSTALLPFARPKSRMSFERGLTRFWQRLFGFSDPSQKRPFLRAISGGAKFLIFETGRHGVSWSAGGLGWIRGARLVETPTERVGSLQSFEGGTPTKRRLLNFLISNCSWKSEELTTALLRFGSPSWTHIEPCVSLHSRSFCGCSSKPETCRSRHRDDREGCPS